MSTFLVFFELRNAKGGYFKVVTMKIHLQFLIENFFIITVSVKFIQNCIKFLWEINLNSAKKIYSIVFIYDVLGDSSSNIFWKLNGARSNKKRKFRNWATIRNCKPNNRSDEFLRQNTSNIWTLSSFMYHIDAYRDNLGA